MGCLNMKKLKTISISILNVLLISCGKSSGTSSSPSLSPNSVSQLEINSEVTLIKGYEQFISLPHELGVFPDSCEVSELSNVIITTPCSCPLFECVVGLTPIETFSTGDFHYTITDGAYTSEPLRVRTNIRDVVPFVMTWTIPGGDLDVTLPLNNLYRYDFTVDWGDGTTAEVTSYGDTDKNHTYLAPGDYNITLTGLVESVEFDISGETSKIIAVPELGTVGWRDFQDAFRGCSNLVTVDGGDTSNVKNMSYMFYNSSSAVPNTTNWNTHRVTNMDNMFYQSDAASPNTTNWDVSNVRTMYRMFYNADIANPNTSSWKTDKLTNTYQMFGYAPLANPDISNWNTSNITNPSGMFLNATSANPDVSNWDTSNMQNMSFMFSGATSADPDMSLWDFSSLTNISGFFQGANNLSSSNYDNLLIALNATAPDSLTIDAGDATTATVDGDNAKAALETRSWTISDGMP
ncbi:MAG: hypothetical protein CME64_02820 [Halobacteriovoraceae bacterium]|nr:hypothetical protein [Halobacteriovoraceae bacterium]|tara:strand:+ start:36149 stop:37540 length:1392 start_codon:yes stop_codon:yes gene_type:complete